MCSTSLDASSTRCVHWLTYKVRVALSRDLSLIKPARPLVGRIGRSDSPKVTVREILTAPLLRPDSEKGLMHRLILFGGTAQPFHN
jgi:hypothetical protein